MLKAWATRNLQGFSRNLRALHTVIDLSSERPYSAIELQPAEASAISDQQPSAQSGKSHNISGLPDKATYKDAI